MRHVFELKGGTVVTEIRLMIGDTYVNGLVDDSRTETWGVIRALGKADLLEMDPLLVERIQRLVESVARSAPPAPDPFEKQ